MLTQALTLLLLAAPAHSLGHLEAGVGGIATGFVYYGGGSAAASSMVFVGARRQLQRLVVEGELEGGFPLERGHAAAVQLILRAGYAGERWELVAGPVAQWAPAARPAVLWLPSARVGYRFSAALLSVGLLDHHARAPADLSVEWSRYTVGYVAPLGATAAVRVPLGRFELAARALYVRLGVAQSAFLTLSARLPTGVRP